MSEDFASKKCVPCEGGMPPMPDGLAHENLKKLNAGWINGGGKIWKEFLWKDFAEAMVFVNKVAAIAEAEGHHPDIHVEYNKVILELTTHSIGGLSENDFIVAAKIEKTLT